MRLNRRRQQFFATLFERTGLSEDDFHRLARYNGERAAGIVHTSEYQARMAELQSRYNRWDGQRS